MTTDILTEEDFAFQLDEFYLDLQQDGSKISLLSKAEIINKPFPGLRPFKTSEFQLFKGRDGQAEELIKRLKNNHFLSVIGSSGTGKSSLIRAGLIPQLFGGYLHEAGNKWNIAICRPGKNPIENLSIALSSLKSHSKEKNKIIDEYKIIEPLLSNSIYGVLEVKELLDKQANECENLLIIIDQFEELFRFGRTDLSKENIENHFVNLLLKASLNPDSSVYVIVTMRSEFLGDCVKYRGLPEAINEGQYLVPQLGRNQLKEVIEGPIALARKKISPKLVELLINEIEETKLKENLDQLPILQHALMRTYQSAMKIDPEAEVDYDYYNAVGGMEMALANHAEAKYNELGDENNDGTPSKKQKIAKLIFQALTDLSTDHKGGRRPTELKNIYAIAEVLNATPKEVDEIINYFRVAETSFIMPPINTQLHPNLVLDISHESLMRNWARLNEWIGEEVKNGKLYKTLNERRELSEQGMDEWIRGGMLEDMLNWKNDFTHSPDWAVRYHQYKKSSDAGNNPDYYKNIGFLDKSKIEAELAKKKLENEIKREQKEKTRGKVIWGFALAACLSIGLAVWGFNSRNIAMVKAGEAYKNEKEAIKQKALADSNFVEANNQRFKAESNAQALAVQSQRAQENANKAMQQSALAKEQTKLAKEFAKFAQEQQALASTYADSAVVQKNIAIAEKLIAQKEAFESRLKDSSWWRMDLLSTTLRDSVKDTLFKLFYHPIDKKPTHTDSLKALGLETSLNLLVEANNEKETNWGIFLHTVKEIKNNYTNFITVPIFDSLLNTTLTIKDKISLADFSSEDYNSADKNILVKFIPDSENDFIVGKNGVFYRYYSKEKITKKLTVSNFNDVCVSISDDASQLLMFDNEIHQFKLYTKKGDVYYAINKSINEIEKNKKVKTTFTEDSETFDSDVNEANIIAKISPDNSLLATFFTGQKYYAIYDLKLMKLVKTMPTDSKEIKGFDFSNDAKQLLVYSTSSASVLNLNTWLETDLENNYNKSSNTHTTDNVYFYNLLAGKFTNHDSAIAIFSSSKKYEWMNNSTYDFIKTTKSDESYTNIILLKNNNQSLIYYKSPYYQRPIKLLDENFIFHKNFPWHKSGVKDISIATNGQTVISADADEIYIWNLNSLPLNIDEIDANIAKSDLQSYYTKKGNDFYYEGKYNEAITTFKELIKFDSVSDNAWNTLGDIYYDMEKYDSAIKFYSKAIDIAPTEISYLNNLANGLYRNDQYEPAKDTYYKSLTIDSTNKFTWNGLGNINYTLKKYDTAKKYYYKAIELNATNTNFYKNLANVYNKEKNYDSTIYYMNKSILLDSSDAGTYKILGGIYLDSGNYNLSISNYKMACRLDSTNSNSFSDLASAYYEADSNVLGKQIAFRSLTLDSANEDAWNDLGLFCGNLKQYDSALMCFHRAFAVNKNNVTIINNLCRLLLILKNYSQVNVYADSALKMDSTNVRAHIYKGFACLKTGKISEGINLLNKAIDTDSTDYASYLYLSAYYAGINNTEKALENLKKSIAHRLLYKNFKLREELFINLKDNDEYIKLREIIKTKTHK